MEDGKEFSDYIKSILIEIANDSKIDIKEFQSKKDVFFENHSILTGFQEITIKYFKDPRNILVE